MAKQRINIVVTQPQHVWLNAQAERLGLTIGEIVRRIIDMQRERMENAARKK